MLSQNQAVIRLPARGALVVVAPSARGKSTLARRLVTDGGLDASGIISMDAVRSELCKERPCECAANQPNGQCPGGTACQCRNGEVWAITNKRLAERAEKQLSYFVDGTNLVRRGRRDEIARAHANGLPAVALLATPMPLAELKRRNLRRPREVPEDILERFHERHAQVTVEGLLEEGFDAVYTWGDNTQFQLMPSGTDGRHLRGPFVVIGDVHGCYHTLMNLLETLGFDQDLLHPEGLIPVMVGDLHDKGGALAAGPDGSGNPEDSGAINTLRWAMKMHALGRLLVVDSNHGDKIIRAIKRPNRVRIGPALKETLDDLAMQPDVETLSQQIVQFLTQVPVSLQLKGGPTRELIVAHAAMKPELVGRNDRKAAGVCNYLREFAWTGRQTLVVGHVITEEPTRERANARAGEVIRIDQGCYKNGGLTAYLASEDRFVRVPTDARDLPSDERQYANRYIPLPGHHQE